MRLNNLWLISGLLASSTSLADSNIKQVVLDGVSSQPGSHPTANTLTDLQRISVQAWPVGESNSQQGPIEIASLVYTKPLARGPEQTLTPVCQSVDQDEIYSALSLKEEGESVTSLGQKLKATVVTYTPPAEFLEENPAITSFQIGFRAEGSGADATETTSTSYIPASYLMKDRKVRILLQLDQLGNVWRVEVHPSVASVDLFPVRPGEEKLTEKQRARREAKRKREEERQAVRQRKLEERRRKLLEERQSAGVNMDEIEKRDAERMRKSQEKKAKKEGGAAKIRKPEQTEPAVTELQLARCGPKPVLNAPIRVNPNGNPETKDEAKTFIQKYWWVLAIFAVTQLIGLAIPAEEEKEKGSKK